MMPTSRMEAAICVYFLVDLRLGRTARNGRMSAMAMRTRAGFECHPHRHSIGVFAVMTAALTAANAVGEIARQGVEMLGAQQRHEMLIRKQRPQGLGDEHQSPLCRLRLLHKHLLAIGVVAIGLIDGVGRRRCLRVSTSPSGLLPCFRRSSSRLLGVHQLAPAQQVLLVGRSQCRLHIAVIGIGDIHRDSDRKLAGFHRPQQPLLALLDQMNDAFDIGERQPGLFGDLGIACSRAASIR